MIYVSSDWHGWPLEDIQRLLDQAGFGEDDFLFVLGDVIDRGENGTELLLWLTRQPNVQLILGNHEAMLLACRFLFEQVTDESLAHLTVEKMSLFQNWLANGGGATLPGLRKLLKQSPDELEGILEYLEDAPLYETVEAGGRLFVLTHGGIDNFDPKKPLEDYEANDFLWARPSPGTVYYRNATVIFGHTPTVYFDEQRRGKPFATASWICIDAGAAEGIRPMVLRLDDMQFFF